MKRFVAFLYGIVAYLFFLASILYAIGWVEGMVVPKGIDDGAISPVPVAIIINVVLMTIFALQHSVMARPQFKGWWTRIVPASIERSTYVLLASLAVALMMWQWRPLPDVVWQVSNPVAAHIVLGISLLGWATVVLSTFLINHFELFGLHQVVNNLMRRPMPVARFHAPLLYKFVRHPIYLGFLLAFWAAPIMSMGRLLFAVVTTAYIFVGAYLEERDLLAVFGDEYRRYRERVSMLVPWRKSA